MRAFNLHETNNLDYLVHVWNIFRPLVFLLASNTDDPSMSDQTHDTHDLELLNRLKAGDQRALGDLADAYSAKIYQLAFRYLRNREDAEEVVQDVLFRCTREVSDFRGDAALVLDLPDHLQHGNVAAADRKVSAATGRRASGDLERRRSAATRHARRRRRLVEPWRRLCFPCRAQAPHFQGDSCAAGNLPRAG